ncbi:hypothetical protein JYB87_03285 [Shewanella avicenniae]|uniref:Uncharacterized protein n=1 Tax=Shewanella avicenniae TaxID=2814294 RepID=A0ABX7QS51_9GAMM|nr:hypothetical protein [Shewanella avicenniae]QSX34289.1 hypothetical protein JYB87_03285 [Shewanella avicenniae]
MLQWMVKYRVWIFLWCLVLLPLLESLYPGTLWGLNWQSPMLTAYVRAYLLLLKLGMLFIVGTVLLALYPYLKPKLKRPIIPVSVLTGLCLMQLPFVLLGVMLNLPSAGYLEHFHNEFSLDGQPFYVYTADPGAFGTAYHYVYRVCPRPLGRYELKELGRLDWMGDIQFHLEGSEFVATGESSPDKPREQRLSLANSDC